MRLFCFSKESKNSLSVSLLTDTLISPTDFQRRIYPWNKNKERKMKKQKLKQEPKKKKATPKTLKETK